MTEETVLRLLKFEIRRRTEEQKSGGWSNWVLVAAIGGLTWTLLGVAEAGGVSLNGCLAETIVAIAFVEFAQVMLTIVSLPGHETERGTRYRHAGEILSAAATPMLLLGLYDVGVIGLLLSPNVGGLLVWWSRWAIAIVYGCQVVAVGAALALSTSKRAINFQAIVADSRARMAGMIAPAALAVSAVSNADVLQSGSLNTLRASALTVAILLLTWKLASRTVYDPAVQALTRIHADLALGHDTAVGCARRFDVAMLGMKLPDVLWREVQGFQDAIRAAKVTMSGIQRTLDGARPGVPLSEQSPEEAREARVAVRRALQILREGRLPIEGELVRAKKWLDNLLGELRSPARLSIATAAERSELHGLLTATYDEFEQSWMGMESSLAALRDEILRGEELIESRERSASGSPSSPVQEPTVS